MELDTATRALSALGQPTRLAVYRALVQAGPEGLQPGALCEALDLPAATLSFHLKALRDAGLVLRSARGRELHYRADFSAMNALLGFLTENCCGGQAELCAPASASPALCCPAEASASTLAAKPSRVRPRAR